MTQLLRHLTPLVQQGNLVEQLEDVIDDKIRNEVSMCQSITVASISLTCSSLECKASQAQANNQLISNLARESILSLA